MLHHVCLSSDEGGAEGKNNKYDVICTCDACAFFLHQQDVRCGAGFCFSGGVFVAKKELGMFVPYAAKSVEQKTDDVCVLFRVPPSLF